MQIIELPYSKNSDALFSNIAIYPWSIWLDSGNHNTLSKTNQQFDIISSFPYKTINANINTTIIQDLIYNINNNNLHIKKNILQETQNTLFNPFDIVNDIITNIANRSSNSLDSSHTKTPPFWHGALGYFGYDLNQTLFKQLKYQSTDSANKIPILAVGIYAWALITDHIKHETYLAYDPNFITSEKINYITNLLLSSPKPAIENNIDAIFTAFTKPNFFTPKVSRKLYNKNFKTIKSHIKNGDCYQVNYSIPFYGHIDQSNIYSWEIYQYLKKLNPNPFGCYFNLDNTENNITIMSFSPERFINIKNNIITTEPIKGTRKNIQHDPILNQKNITELLNSVKDRAENVMITDLMRNDLNKYCIPGTVTTPNICALHTFPTVHHLISTVTGVIKPEFSSIDVFKGCFPGGSITGAPKIKTMEIIQNLENYDGKLKRYIYCGSIGYININNNLDMNIAIRTAVLDKNTNNLYYWAGGGIVADSDVENEYDEILTKLIKLF